MQMDKASQCYGRGGSTKNFLGRYGKPNLQKAEECRMELQKLRKRTNNPRFRRDMDKLRQSGYVPSSDKEYGGPLERH